MSTYRYTATAPDGQKVKGTLEGSSPTVVRLTLLERELNPVKLKQKKSLLKFEFSRKRVPATEIMNFSRQLAAFVRAGIPILEALDAMSEETGNSRFKAILIDVADALRAGETFSGAISVHKEVFPPYYLGILRSAELTGHLDSALEQLSSYMERDVEAKRKIRSALAYPAVILFMSVVTVAIITGFVLPRFRKFFAQLNSTLPLPTRILLSISAFLSDWWWALLAGGLVIIVGGIAYMKTERGRALKSGIFLKTPVIQEITRFSIVERFCRILASMLRAGVPLPEAMQVATEGTNNVVYERGLNAVREEMLKGEGIAHPIGATELFPRPVIQMIRVGEDTGTLDAQLESAAGFYAQELEHRIKRLTTLFEPAVIMAMGLIVGFVAIALISAMYGIFKQAGIGG